VQKDDEDAWVCWMGSGYDNVAGKLTQGHYFYAVDLDSGSKFWSFYVTEIKTDVKWPNGRNIIRSIPGSPNIVDIDSDGYTDRVYVGDLEGRMWKVDVSIPWVRANSWTADNIYMDDDNYPIVTKPEIYMAPSMVNPQPRVYFGTGGDDDAPNDGQFAFIAIIDDGADTLEWFMGDPGELGFNEGADRGDLGLGEKVWADPRIANGIIYFSTLYGSIESVDPIANLAGEGKLYARNLGSIAGSVGGGSAFTDENKNPVESLTLKIKTRSAVTLGETQSGGSGRRQDVYIQEYDSTIQKLEQPTGSVLTIKSWREVYRIKRNP
jgi:Tfp pilus tip-associated adhesin PilY1